MKVFKKKTTVPCFIRCLILQGFVHEKSGFNPQVMKIRFANLINRFQMAASKLKKGS